MSSRTQERVMSATMKSEYASNFINQSRHSRTSSAITFGTTGMSNKSTTTRESLVYPHRIKQPDSFLELIQGKYTADHIEKQREQDRIDYVKHLLFGRKRTFKNHIDNNSNQLRKLEAHKKIKLMSQMEAKENEIHDYLQTATMDKIQYRNYNEKALLLLKPTTSINGLVKATRSMKPRQAKTTTMSLGTHNNTREGEGKFKSNVGFYLSNTTEIDKIAIKNNIKAKRPKSTKSGKVRKMNKDLV